MRTRIAFLLLLLSCWFVQPQPVVAAEPLDVSLIQLIANPKDYDGKIVRVCGFLRIEFEGNSIYLHQDDSKYGLTRNGLWVDVSKDMQKEKAKLDQKYVLIEGRFEAKMTGHMGLWSGSIQKITRCQVWPPFLHSQ